MPTVHSDDWTLQAKCRGMEDALFPEGADQKRARSICMGCPVRTECLAEALDNRIEWGVWGGMTERERRQLLRQRTDIESWSAVLLGGKKKAAAKDAAGKAAEKSDGAVKPIRREPVAPAATAVPPKQVEPVAAPEPGRKTARKTA